MGFTIKELLSSPELPGLKLAAGKKGSNHLIRNASVVDCPDGFDWMLPGDFVLTSGYIFRDSEALQRKLVQKLSQLACAGLGIKSDKYWDRIPDAILEEADRLGLPVVSVPLHCTLNEIQVHIFRQTSDREDTLLQKYMKIHKQLIDYSLSEQNLDAITANTSELISNPLLIVSKRWLLLSFAEHRDNPVPLQRALNLEKMQPVFSARFFNDIPKDIEDYKKPIKRTFATDYGPVTCCILPIRANTELYGYMVVWETVRKLRSIEYMCLEQAVIIIALERIKTKRVEESRHSLKQDFFSDLIEGRIESAAAAYNLARVHGLDNGRPHVCAVIRIDGLYGREPQDARAELLSSDSMQRSMIKSCQEFFFLRHRNAFVFHRSSNLIVLLQLENDEDANNPGAREKELCTELYRTLSALPFRPEIVIGIGGESPDILNLKKSFFEAQEALRISSLIGSGESVNWFGELMVYNILGSGVPKSVLQDFFSSSIGPLASYDKENHTNLVDTLEIYLLENQNSSSAAKKLFVHRNTMAYRINKIKQLLNFDFSDTEKLLRLQIGIRIMRLLRGSD